MLLSRITILIVSLLANLSLLSAKEKVRTEALREKVLLISIDGFRWDFRNKTQTPTLDRLVRKGASAGYVKNVFPTSTIPNHQSIVTGLYPENHGMIDNSFMDPATGLIFKGLGEKDLRNEWWNQTIPIWRENEIQGHKSGVMYWPGNHVKYNGSLPSYRAPDKYDPFYGKETMKTDKQIKMVTTWLKDDKVNLVVLYLPAVDDAAHNMGPDSNDTKKAIEELDGFIKSLMDQLEKEKLLSIVNMVIIGDHGHVSTTNERSIHLDQYFDTKKELRYLGTFTNVFIYPKFGRTKYVYKKLKEATTKHKHYQVYLKKDIPEHFHVKKNNRTADILLLPDPGWIVKADTLQVPYLKGEWERGDHGYSNQEKVMSPAFFAIGPAFREGYRVSVIHTVDVYGLICHLLNIEPHKNDGRFERIKSVLKEFEKK